MTWFKVDDGFPEHRKLEDLEQDPEEWASCLAVWLAAGCDCSRRLTEGKISSARLARITPFGKKSLAIADRLVALNLWEKIGSDYLFHDWCDYQPTAEIIKETREKARERKRKWDEQRRRNKHGNGVSNAPGNGVSNGEPDATPSRPDPDPDPVPDPDPTRPRPYPDPDHDLYPSPGERDELKLSDVERIGFARFGALAGEHGAKIQRLSPIRREELDLAMKTDARTWKYIAIVIEGIREERSKPKPASAQPPTRRNLSPSEERAQENATRFEAERLERKRLRALGKSEEEIEEIEKQQRQSGAAYG